MKIAFLHYHLNPGGVTTVIGQQVEAIQNQAEVLLLCGKKPEASWPVEIVAIPELGYDDPNRPEVAPQEIARTVHGAIRAKWPDGCDLIHIHNPTLCKNRQLLTALKILQHKDLRLFLHIHDFAEDGRPEVYSGDAYPADCHYAVLNTRDYGILEKAGLKPEGLHLLPNTVTPLKMAQSQSGKAPFVLYPVRAIRRKNIGEAILLSLFFADRETLAITLPPNSDEDMLSHIGWQTFARNKRLNVVFDAGIRQDYLSLVQNAHYMITTSINEGFGFTFLEPWTAGKGLWGRKLSGVCDDFEKRGIQLDHLYASIETPTSWFNGKQFVKRCLASFKAACRKFDKTTDMKKAGHIFGAMIQNETIDFGLLDESAQKEVINRVTTVSSAKKRLIQHNPFLENPGRIENGPKIIQHNRDAILSQYSKKIYTKRLMDIYAAVINRPVKQAIDKESLLDIFLDPRDFSLLKWARSMAAD